MVGEGVASKKAFTRWSRPSLSRPSPLRLFFSRTHRRRRNLFTDKSYYIGELLRGDPPSILLRRSETFRAPSSERLSKSSS